MHKYKYTGETEVNISYVATVKPGETIESEVVIKHPDFQAVTDNKKESKKEDK